MKFSLLVISISFCLSLSAQVTLQTGSASYSIPMFSFSDAKSGLGTSVGLNYSSGKGLQVTDIASETGQGWSLLAGGSIIRKQNGEPDDQNSTFFFPAYLYNQPLGYNQSIALYADQTAAAYDYVDNYYPNGFLYTEFPNINFYDGPGQETYASPKELAMSPRFRSAHNKNWKQSRRALADRQQDEFIYNFNGRMGSFVLGKDGTPTVLDQSKLIIEKVTSYNIMDPNLASQYTRISEFTIKDETGTIYKFLWSGRSEVMKVKKKPFNGTLSNPFPDMDTMICEPTGKYTIQEWKLTEIVNPITNEKISFEYETYETDIVSATVPGYQLLEGPSAETYQIYEQLSLIHI